MESISKQYLKGFNHGYLISNYMKPLFNLLNSSMPKLGEYGLGFKDGGREIAQNKEQDILSKLSQLRKDNKNNEQQLDR